MRCDNLLGESERWVDRYGMCHASLLCQSHILLREDTITECEGFLCGPKATVVQNFGQGDTAFCVTHIII